MSGCEQHRAELSALLDGESQAGAIVETLDHLVRCADCRDFYRDLRSFQGRIDALPGVAVTEPAPAAIPRPADTIRSFPARRRQAPPRWVWHLAAMLVIAVGLTTLLLQAPITGEGDGAGGPVAAVATEGPETAMSDQRFAGLTAELLEADVRYQRRMYAILGSVGADRGLDEAPAEELLWRYRNLNDVQDTDRYDFAVARRDGRGLGDNPGELLAAPESGNILY